NNSGKTNVLKALNIFFNPDQYNLIEDIPNHKLGSRGGSTYPEIILTFEKGNVEHIIKREFGVNGISNETYERITTDDGESIKNSLDSKEVGKILNQISFFFIPAINISFPTLINNLIDDVY